MVTLSSRARLSIVVALACVAVMVASAGDAPATTNAVSLMSAPQAPGAPEAIAGDTRAIVAVPEPATGAAPEGYVVTATPGGNTCSIAGTATLRVCTINALTNGVAYTFSAVATTSAGSSPASTASNSITPGDMLAYDSALTLTGDDQIGTVVLMDPEGEFLLLGARNCCTHPSRITKVSVPDMTVQAVLTLNAGEYSLLSGAIDADGRFAYFSNGEGHVVKVDAETMTRVAVASVEAGEIRAQRLVFDAHRDVVYAVMYSDPGKVVKYSTSLARLSTVTLPAEAKYPNSAALASDGASLYAGNSRHWTGAAWLEARVARLDLDVFTDASVIAAPMEVNDQNLTSMVLGHDDHLYVGTNTSAGRVLKVSTSALSREAAITLSAGENELLHAVSTPDRRQAFFSTNIAPSSTLSKFDLAVAGSPGYASVSSITLPVAVTQVASMTMDPFGHRIYIGSNNTPAKVVAVTVGPAPRRLPREPLAVGATASVTTADVTWQAPNDTGGLTLQGFAVEQAGDHAGPWTPASGTCALATTRASTAVTCTATGLGNQGYVFRVAARTTGGQGAWASTSAVVTPTGTTPTTTVPTSVSPLVTQPVSTVITTTTTTAPSTTSPVEVPSTSLAPAPIAPATPRAVVTGQTITMGDGNVQLRVEPVACDAVECAVTLDAGGRPTITLSQSGRVRVTGDGFRPGTLAQVWMFSEPVFLGALPVSADGSFSGELAMPGVAPGDHTLQVHGLTATGEPRSAELGLRVLSAGELPATGTRSSEMLVASVLLAVLGAALWLRPRRHRAGRDTGIVVPGG